MKVFALLIVAVIGCSMVDARAVRDLKSTLITRGNDLIKKADEAIKKLEADKKTHEVQVVKSEEAAIQKLVKELEAATDAHKITQLEHELVRAETKLQFELLKINHGGHVIPDRKELLLKRAEALEKQADALIKKLKEEKKDTEAAAVEKDEALVKKYVAELKAATSTTDLAHIEKELADAERRLARDIHHPHTRDVKSDLIAKSKTLITKADEAIKKAEAAHKAHDVATLKSEEARIKKLAADLEAETDATKITHLEHSLGRAETRLEHHLQHLNHQPHTRDVKSDLIAKSKTLITKAEEAIKKAEAAHKAHDVATLKSEESRIKKLAADLEAETDATKITHLEHSLGRAETRLEHHLQHLNH